MTKYRDFCGSNGLHTKHSILDPIVSYPYFICLNTRPFILNQKTETDTLRQKTRQHQHRQLTLTRTQLLSITRKPDVEEALPGLRRHVPPVSLRHSQDQQTSIAQPEKSLDARTPCLRLGCTPQERWKNRTSWR